MGEIQLPNLRQQEIYEILQGSLQPQLCKGMVSVRSSVMSATVCRYLGCSSRSKGQRSPWLGQKNHLVFYLWWI